MDAAPPPLSILRHALADPLSAAATKVEVLVGRLAREAPALSARASDVARDLEDAGRLLDLLPALVAIAAEAPGRLPLSDLAKPEGASVAPESRTTFLRVRSESAADAVRRVAAFGRSRGAEPRVRASRTSTHGEIVVAPLGPAPAEPVERLLRLPREVPEAEALFLAYAALVADGGSLGLAVEDGVLRATLAWPLAGEEA